MLRWQQWNRKFKAALWALTLLGVIAALPLGAVRWQMEQGTTDQVEYVMDFKDVELIASYQYDPDAFIEQQLAQLKSAGVTTMAVFESTLDELVMAKRLSLFNSSQLALLDGQTSVPDRNDTYVLFAGAEEERVLGPLITAAFTRSGIAVEQWSRDGRPGLKLATPIESATLVSMNPDPMALSQIQIAGFRILPRLSDRIPYNETEARQLLQQLKQYGVDRILFDGDSVKGYNDNEEKKSLYSFASLLKEEGIGLAAIEGLKSPQLGFNTLAYLTDYNVVRLHSLSDSLTATIEPETLADRFLLAAKDRNIRMFYLNAGPTRSFDKGAVVDPMDKLAESLSTAVQKLDDFGFHSGVAQPFTVDTPGWAKAAKAIVCLGAISIIALLIGAFASWLTIPAFALGAVGSAGLYIVSKSTLEQGLALGAAISAPTLALIWALNVIRRRTEGSRRIVGGGEWTDASARSHAAASAEGAAGRSGRGGIAEWSSLLGDIFGIGRVKWVFNGLSAGERFRSAIALFVVTSLISLLGITFVFGLLNNITYSLLLQQFRGVSLLHLAPIFLVAMYLFLYMGASIAGSIRKLLSIQITVFWVIVAAVAGIVGLYYLSRTGNAGTASSLELTFRNFLETTFGVRPRSKEFLLGHPLLLLGLFLSLRYRAAWVFIIVGSIGQLSMVDTFAHIHTPMRISLIRDFLGLGMGAVIGCVLIGIWLIGEGVWRQWLRAKIVRSAA